MDVLRMAGVTRSFGGVPVVRDLTVELVPGAITGLLGPNGAGKSTTFRLILGWTRPDRGDVRLFGRPPDDAGRARVGFAPEARALPESCSPAELFSLHLGLRGATRADARVGARRWCERLDLAPDARIGELSNGQQQRAQLGLALLADGDLLLLDEPLTALDPGHQDGVIALFREVAARGAAVLVATHRLREAEAFVDRVVLLKEGVKRLDTDLRVALREASDGAWLVTADRPDALRVPGVSEVEREGASWRVRLEPGVALGAVLASWGDAGVTGLREVVPTLADLYARATR